MSGTAVARADEARDHREIVHQAEQTARNVSALGGGREAFDTSVRIAKSIASSSIVPQEYQGNVANVLVAMEYANRLGASVLAVAQNLDIIHGRPSLRATFLIGTVNASGRFSPIRYRWQGEEGTDSWGCRAVAVDRESGEECVGPLVTVETAKAEGWYQKKGSKWQTIPELMLMYRAGAWWTRVYSPELSLGLHTSEELHDVGPGRMERVQGAAEALDAPDAPDAPREPRVIEGEEIVDGPEEDDRSDATDSQIDQLESLREKARAADLLKSTDEESIAESLDARDGPMVRTWVQELSSRLARAGGDS